MSQRQVPAGDDHFDDFLRSAFAESSAHLAGSMSAERALGDLLEQSAPAPPAESDVEWFGLHSSEPNPGGEPRRSDGWQARALGAGDGSDGSMPPRRRAGWALPASLVAAVVLVAVMAVGVGRGGGEQGGVGSPEERPETETSPEQLAEMLNGLDGSIWNLTRFTTVDGDGEVVEEVNLWDLQGDGASHVLLSFDADDVRLDVAGVRRRQAVRAIGNHLWFGPAKGEEFGGWPPAGSQPSPDMWHLVSEAFSSQPTMTTGLGWLRVESDSVTLDFALAPGSGWLPRTDRELADALAAEHWVLSRFGHTWPDDSTIFGGVLDGPLVGLAATVELVGPGVAEGEATTPIQWRVGALTENWTDVTIQDGRLGFETSPAVAAANPGALEEPSPGLWSAVAEAVQANPEVRFSADHFSYDREPDAMLLVTPRATLEFRPADVVLRHQLRGTAWDLARIGETDPRSPGGVTSFTQVPDGSGVSVVFADRAGDQWCCWTSQVRAGDRSLLGFPYEMSLTPPLEPVWRSLPGVTLTEPVPGLWASTRELFSSGPSINNLGEGELVIANDDVTMVFTRRPED